MPDVAPNALRGRLGSWRPSAGIWGRRAGSWRECQAYYAKRGGTWRLVWVLTPSKASNVQVIPDAAGTGTATFTWTIPADNNVDSWEVGYTDAGGTYTVLSTVASTVSSLAVTTLAGRNVKATVKGVKFGAAGEDVSSALTPIPPRTPTGLNSTRVGYTMIRNVWVAPASSTVVKYRVYYGGSEKGAPTLLTADYTGTYNTTVTITVKAEGEGGGLSDAATDTVALSTLAHSIVLNAESYNYLEMRQTAIPTFTVSTNVYVNSSLKSTLTADAPTLSTYRWTGPAQMTCYETMWRAYDAFGSTLDSNKVRRKTGKPASGGVTAWRSPATGDYSYDCNRDENTAITIPAGVTVNNLAHSSACNASHWCDNSGGIGRYVDVYRGLGGSGITYRHADHFAATILENIPMYGQTSGYVGLGFVGGGWSTSGGVHSWGGWHVDGTVNTTVPAVANTSC